MSNNRNKGQETTTPKIKVLAYCDSPSCATGFGTVSRNILSGLYATGRYNIDVLGINYWGDPHEFPFRIWPTGVNQDKDPYGRKKVFSMIQQMDYDILFFLQDTFILDFLPELHNQLRSKGKDFKSICYYPVDGTPKEKWLHNVNACDQLVAYSEFGKVQSQEVLPIIKEPMIIPHGANVRDYHVANTKDTMAFRAQFFGAQAGKFVFTNLNRNQQRKDIPRTIQAFSEFHKDVPESLLYLHMAKKDQGWDLAEVVNAYGLSMSEDVIFPENFGPNQGYPRHIVNMIYNVSDCVLSTTLGEGWGLCLHEDTNVMTTKGQVKIKNIKVGDRVVVAGKDFVVNGISADIKDVEYSIKLFNNQTLLGSAEHKIPTGSDTYKNMSDVTEDDWLMVDKAILYEDSEYVYDLSKYSDSCDAEFVWNKMGFSPKLENSISAIMKATGETKKIVESGIASFCSVFNISSDRVASVVSYLDNIGYNKNEPVKINRLITFDADFARLLGYYVAEGSNENGKGIEFSFHKNEKEYHNDVKYLIKSYFGIECIEKIEDNRCALRVRSSILSKFFGDVCGVHASNKHIPFLCLQHRNKAIEFLKGCWRGDGHFGNIELSYSTASIQLKEEIMWLMTAFNVFSKSNIDSSDNWAIYVNGEDYNILADILGHNGSHDNYRDRVYLKKFDKFFLLKVKEISHTEASGLYCDISVDNMKHFVANGIMVHNSWVEAMATKTPVIMPGNTALVENITEDRGWLVKSGTNPSLFTVVPNDNEIVRPLVDVEDMVKAMHEVYSNKEEAKRRAENAYNWVTTKMDWANSVVPQWVEVFDQAYDDLKSGKEQPVDPSSEVIDTESF